MIILAQSDDQSVIETVPQSNPPGLLPPVQHVQLSATNAGEMQQRQADLTKWFIAKLREAEREVEQAQANLESIQQADTDFNIRPFKTALRRMKNEVIFYEKCCHAAEAGHALVPNFPIDVFAVRTERNKPKRNDTDRRWATHQQKPDPNLTLGTGDYVDSIPFVGSYVEPQADWDVKNEKWISKTYFYASSFDTVNFPESMRDATIITTVDRSMQIGCFDDYGVLPNRRTTGDPIIVGRIHRPNRRRAPLCFLIAWYIDTRTL